MTAFQAPQLAVGSSKRACPPLPHLEPHWPRAAETVPQPRLWYSPVEPVEPVAEEDKEQENVVHLYTDRPLSGLRDEHDLGRGSAFPEQREEKTKDWLNLPMLVKLDSIHLLIEWQFQSPGRLREAMTSDDREANWFILVNHCAMDAHNHLQRTPEDLSEDAWGSGSQNEYCCCNLGLAIGRNHGLSIFFAHLSILWPFRVDF
ncbi:hypothetical protein B0H14DRAFT_2621571 [Mycena olivaceomarginata]|nr:hypothetical protein B0H14DRAFT_2621571 [Mycena olivaceomarginata]